MTIKHIRVDERLIHGQVATVWTHSLNVDRIAVVNDKVVKNELEINALKLARPAGIKLSILSVEKAVRNFNVGKYDDDEVLVLFRNIKDVRRAFDLGLKITTFNVGNLSHKEGQTKIKKSVSLSDEDITILRTLVNDGIEVTAQMIPNEPATGILSFIDKANQ